MKIGNGRTGLCLILPLFSSVATNQTSNFDFIIYKVGMITVNGLLGLLGRQCTQRCFVNCDMLCKGKYYLLLIISAYVMPRCVCLCMLQIQICIV